MGQQSNKVQKRRRRIRYEKRRNELARSKPAAKAGRASRKA